MYMFSTLQDQGRETDETGIGTMSERDTGVGREIGEQKLVALWPNLQLVIPSPSFTHRDVGRYGEREMNKEPSKHKKEEEEEENEEDLDGECMSVCISESVSTVS